MFALKNRIWNKSKLNSAILIVFGVSLENVSEKYQRIDVIARGTTKTEKQALIAELVTEINVNGNTWEQ